jgi:PAS domain-containing protein
MQIDWRILCGPAIVAAMAPLAIMTDRHFTVAPGLAPLLVCIVAFATSFSGIVSGLISAAVAVSLATPFLQSAGLGLLDRTDTASLMVFAISAFGTAIITGLLRRQTLRAFARERSEQAMAKRLATALDQIDIGIVLLDANTRAEFINRSFRDNFALPDEKADSKPPFVALMYHGRDTRAYQLPDDELNAFVARRTEMIRAGDSTPLILRLANGKVLRLVCTPLPDGGRMLSYTPVTDMVRASDDLTKKDHYLSLRGGGQFQSPAALRAAE